MWHLFLQLLGPEHVDGDFARGNDILFGNNLDRLDRRSTTGLLRRRL